MDHLHDELDDADLKFLQRFEEIEKDKKNVDEADPEGVKQSQDFDHTPDPNSKNTDPGDIDPIHGEFKVEGQHDHEIPQGKGQQGGQSQEGDGEGESEGEGEQGKGQDKGNSEGQDEGQGENDDGEGEGEGEGDGEGDEGDDEGDEKPECDGDCQESDEDEGEECPYCQEKAKRQEQQEAEEEDGEGGPIAEDMNGEDIFVGSEIMSTADGVDNDREDAYVGVVMGLAHGDRERFDEDEKGRRILVVCRRDGEEGGYIVEGERDTMGWGVQADLTVLKPAEDQQDQQQQKQRKQDKGPVLGQDREGKPFYDGDRLSVVVAGNSRDFPIEGIVTVHGATYDYAEKPLPHAGFTGDNFPMESVCGEATEEAMQEVPHAYHFAGGKRAFTFAIPIEGHEPKQWDKLVIYERRDEEKEEDDNMNEEEDFEFEVPKDEEEKKPLTKNQRDRFKNLCERIFKKSEQTFGNTIESKDMSPELPGGVFDGEEIAKVYEIVSRGVVYRVTVSAERVE